MTETDVLTLVELVQIALPRLDFDNADQRLAGSELLWLANHVGAAYEYRESDNPADAGRFLTLTKQRR